MTHDEFRIGEEFWCGGRCWRCTDLGTRVIVAICLDSHEVEFSKDASDGKRAAQSRIVGDDHFWFAGPPYAVGEMVFDEDDIIACTLPQDDSPEAAGFPAAPSEQLSLDGCACYLRSENGV